MRGGRSYVRGWGELYEGEKCDGREPLERTGETGEGGGHCPVVAGDSRQQRVIRERPGHHSQLGCLLRNRLPSVFTGFVSPSY